MNKLVISSILYYGRCYDEGEVSYYINLGDLKVYSRTDLVQNYNFTDEILSNDFLLSNTYQFIPMFRVNIVDEMKKFLYNLNNRHISKEIIALDSEQLCIYFQTYIELNLGAHQRWREQEKQSLTTAAIDWCKRYHIPYVY